MQQKKRHFSSSSLLQAIEEMGLAGTWSKDLVTGEQRWSVGLSQMLGHQSASEPMSFDTFLERVHPDDRQWISETASRDFHLLPSERHIRIIQRSGILRWAHLRSQVLFAPTGEAICMLFIFVDITEKQQAIETLAQLDRRFAALATSFRATLFTCSADGEKVNVHNWRPLGLQSAAAFSFRAFLEDVIPEHRERVERHWTATMSEKKPTSIRYKRFSLISDDILDMVYFVRPIFKEDGAVLEWVGLAVMISDDDNAAAPQLAIKGTHVRAARALLDWSIDDLAGHSGVSTSTIRRIEREATFSPRSQNSLLIKQSLESSGVEFSQTATGATAVSLRS